MPRLYREAPLASIWEGSGNVMSLDVLRALTRSPRSLEVFLDEVEQAAGADARLDARVDEAQGRSSPTPPRSRARARRVVEGMALCLQGSLLVRHAPPAVADAFCASRLAGDGGLEYGTLPAGIDFEAHHRAQPAAAELEPYAAPGAPRSPTAAPTIESWRRARTSSWRASSGSASASASAGSSCCSSSSTGSSTTTSTNPRRLAARPPTWSRSPRRSATSLSLILHELGHALVARRIGHRDRRHRPVVLRRPLADAPRARRRPARSSRSRPPGRW